ncbi:hypothetical protein [Microbispora rosea]|uniref:hypothetical protein n=1 Tax=Microbispora rosea TaxID=58117 RepID=UPI003D9142C8
MDLLESLSEGPWGLLIGALLGLLLAVWLEDPLKKLSSRANRRIRVTRTKRVDPAQRAPFSLGPIRTDCIIIEGDGETPILEESIYVIVDPRPVEIPSEIQEWRQEITEDQERKRTEGQQAAWNGECYAVERFVISRRAHDESPEVFIRLSYADFYTFLATQNLDRRFTDGTTPRSRYLLNCLPEDAPGFLACSFGTNIAVITSDQKLIISRRSERVQTFPGLWSSSANEALSRSIDSRGRSVPSLYAVARRGLSEELAIHSTECDLQLLAFTIVTSHHQWGALFIGRLHDITAKELEDRWGRGVSDRWEHSEHCFIPFKAADFLDFAFHPQRVHMWSPQAPTLYYLALVNEYGRARVESEIKKAVRRRPH